MSFFIAFGVAIGCLFFVVTVLHVVKHYTNKDVSPIWVIFGSLLLAFIALEIIKYV